MNIHQPFSPSKIFFLVSTTLILFMFSLLSTGCTKSEDLALNHYDKGLSLFQTKDYNSAIIEFRNALQLDPRMAKAHYHLGLAYVEIGDPINAYRELEMASQFDPSNLDALIKAAEMLFLNIAVIAF